MRQLHILLFLLVSQFIWSQKQNLVCYPPLEIPLQLAGSFSELRANHFHSGIDIRTNGEENLPVFAAEDGYVERIKISGAGYGKAIYIAHNSGYTTVYAHLNSFIPEIQTRLLDEHKKRKSYELDWYPEKGAIQVKRGQLIAYSGNTGGSSGPHLHFEVRNSATEVALNPLNFGLVISDSLAPFYTGICLMELERGAPSSMLGAFLPKVTPVSAGEIRDTLQVFSDKFRVAASIEDPFGTGSRSCGLDELTLYFDGKEQYHMKMTEVNFSTSKAINGFQPFGVNKNNKGQWYGCYRTENMPLHTVDKMGSGILQIHDSLVHELKFVASDWQGNRTELIVHVRKNVQLKESVEDWSKKGLLCESGKKHTLNWKGGSLILAETALYDDAHIFIPNSGITQTKGEKTYYQVCTVGHSLITLFKGAELVLDCSDLPETQRTKAVIVRESGNSWVSEGGSLEGLKLKTAVSTLGKFAIAIDTEKPLVEVEKWSFHSKSEEFVIVLRVTDDLSGISSMDPEINGSWVYYETDKKTNSLTCRVQGLSVGEHQFKLTVKDKVGNKKVFEKTIRISDSNK
ncbi:MAG: M23 family metallopeptidase [Bacteroidota bacterium]